VETIIASHSAEAARRATPPYPGIRAIVDGSEAAAHVESRLAEVACVYPITPSTTMAAIYQAAVAAGKKDLWGTPIAFIEPESEHSSASAAEGVALAGGRVTNFTAGQGLVLMKEVLYVIAGKRLPVVFHVGARALTSQALNIHAGHDDLMAVADTGWAILVARNAQEVADLAAIARRAAEASETPFIVAQDGFLTTHTLENVRLPEDELLREFVGEPRPRVRDLFDPAEALMTGVVQNQDSYMKGRIGQRVYTDRVPAALDDAMTEWNRLTGRHYGAIDTYRTEDAAHILDGPGHHRRLLDQLATREVIDHPIELAPDLLGPLAEIDELRPRLFHGIVKAREVGRKGCGEGHRLFFRFRLLSLEVEGLDQYRIDVDGEREQLVVRPVHYSADLKVRDGEGPPALIFFCSSRSAVIFASCA